MIAFISVFHFLFCPKQINMKQNLLPLMAAALLFTACASKSSETSSKDAAKFDLAAARTAVEESNAQFDKAAIAGDSAAIVARYHSEAMVYPPNMAAGDRTLMGSMMKTMPAMGVKTTKLTTTTLEGDENMLVETGTYEMGDGSKTLEQGKFIVVWKKEDGQWKMYRDIWNSDMPSAAGN